MNRVAMLAMAMASMYPGSACEVISTPRETYRDRPRDPIVITTRRKPKLSKLARRARRASKLGRVEAKIRRASTPAPNDTSRSQAVGPRGGTRG